MDKFIENIKEIMKEDRKRIILNSDIEELYIWELADNWIDMNIQTEYEFKKKINALGNILNTEDFKSAIQSSKIAFNENNTEEAKATAELIKKIRNTEEYKENSKVCNYKILEKYEDYETYKTDSFIVHTNIMLRMYKYLEETAKKIEIHN